jgi:Spx/MgsR family transcriptional regulator
MTSLPVLYGIPNCETVKKARSELDARGQAYSFFNFKTEGVPAAHLARWIETAGWERVLNRRGTTWRRLDETARSGVTDAASAALVMEAHPSLIKRPVVEWPDGSLTIGFSKNQFLEVEHV